MALADAYRDHVSVSQLARQEGVSRARIYQLLRKEKIKVGKPTALEIALDLAADYMLRGLRLPSTSDLGRPKAQRDGWPTWAAIRRHCRYYADFLQLAEKRARKLAKAQGVSWPKR